MVIVDIHVKLFRALQTKQSFGAAISAAYLTAAADVWHQTQAVFGRNESLNVTETSLSCNSSHFSCSWMRRFSWAVTEWRWKSSGPYKSGTATVHSFTVNEALEEGSVGAPELRLLITSSFFARFKDREISCLLDPLLSINVALNYPRLMRFIILQEQRGIACHNKIKTSSHCHVIVQFSCNYDGNLDKLRKKKKKGKRVNLFCYCKFP